MIAIVVTTFLAYVTCLKNGFVMNDVAVITLNKLTIKGISAIPEMFKTSLFYGFNGLNEGTYRPIPMMMFATVHHFFKNNPMPYHLLNLLFYGASLILILKIFLKIFEKVPVYLAGIIVLLFALHPIHTEVVANIKSLDEILCLFFVLLSFYFLFLKDSANPVNQILSGIAFLLSILSKESTITLCLIGPFLFFLKYNDFKKFLVVVGIFMFFFLIYYQIKTEIFGSFSGIKNHIDKLDNFIIYLPKSQKISTALGLYCDYIIKLILPLKLSHNYSFGVLSPYKWLSIETIVTLILLGLSFFRLIKSKFKFDIINSGIIWFWSFSVVTSNLFLMIGSSFNERFMFIPSLGFMMIVLGLVDQYLIQNQKVKPNLIIYGSLGISLLFFIKTFDRTKDWKNNLSLYSKDISTTPLSARSQYNLGNEYWSLANQSLDVADKKEYLQKAIPYIDKSIEIYPNYDEAILCLQDVYHQLGMTDKELALVGKTHSVSKENPSISYNAGNAALSKQDFKTAIRYFRNAIGINPHFAEAYSNAASTYFQAGMMDSAIIMSDSAIKIDPKIPHPYINKSQALAQVSKDAEALEVIKKAKKIFPDVPEIRMVEGNILMHQKKFKDAINSFMRVQTQLPNDQDAAYNIGVCYINLKKFNDAISNFLLVLRLSPKNVNSNLNTGYCYYQLKKYSEAKKYYDNVLKIQPTNRTAMRTLDIILKH